jgi:hypothetical protein
MGCKYFDDELAVFHGIFRGLRVRDLRRGTQIVPSIELMSQTLHTWSELPKIRFSSKRARDLAEWRLFGDCGRLTVDPRNAKSLTLLMLDPKMLAEHYWRQGEMDAISEQS